MSLVFAITAVPAEQFWIIFERLVREGIRVAPAAAISTPQWTDSGHLNETGAPYIPRSERAMLQGLQKCEQRQYSGAHGMDPLVRPAAREEFGREGHHVV